LKLLVNFKIIAIQVDNHFFYFGYPSLSDH